VSEEERQALTEFLAFILRFVSRHGTPAEQAARWSTGRPSTKHSETSEHPWHKSCSTEVEIVIDDVSLRGVLYSRMTGESFNCSAAMHGIETAVAKRCCARRRVIALKAEEGSRRNERRPAQRTMTKLLEAHKRYTERALEIYEANIDAQLQAFTRATDRAEEELVSNWTADKQIGHDLTGEAHP